MGALAASQHDQEDGHGVWCGPVTRQGFRVGVHGRTRAQAPRFSEEGPPGLQGPPRGWSPGPAGPRERGVPPREAVADEGRSQLPGHSKSRRASASSPGFPGLRTRQPGETSSANGHSGP